MEAHDKFDEDAALTWLKGAVEENKTSHRELGIAWGVKGEDPGNFVTKTLGGTRKLKLHEFLASREYYGQPVEYPPVPLMGKVGAGGHIHGMSDEPLEYLEDIRGKKPGTLAVVVDGTSMGHVIPDGSILFYDVIYESPLDEHVNQICIVWRADGKNMVKKLLRGSRRDRWSLLSLTDGGIEEDVVLDYVAKVNGVEFR